MGDPPEGLPGNLSRRATADFLSILRRSEHQWGVETALRTRARLLHRFWQIADGSAVDHQRQDVKPRTPTLFLNEDPWVIAYRPATHQVLRVLHGARDFHAIYPPRA
jgi:plasmid stabilization system protein ParE